MLRFFSADEKIMEKVKGEEKREGGNGWVGRVYLSVLPVFASDIRNVYALSLVSMRALTFHITAPGSH